MNSVGPTPAHIPRAHIELVVDLYRENTMRYVAEVTGYDVKTVRRILQNEGVTIRHLVRRDSIDLSTAVKAYDQLGSLKLTGEVFGVSAQTIMLLFREHGVQYASRSETSPRNLKKAKWKLSAPHEFGEYRRCKWCGSKYGKRMDVRNCRARLKMSPMTNG